MSSTNRRFTTTSTSRSRDDRTDDDSATQWMLPPSSLASNISDTGHFSYSSLLSTNPTAAAITSPSNKELRLRTIDEVSISEQLIKNKTDKAQTDIEQLKTLNDKLQQYTDRAYTLDKENSRLARQISARKSKCVSANLSIASRTDELWRELHQLRSSLNDESRSLNQSELILRNLLNEVEESRNKIRSYREEVYAETTRLSAMHIEDDDKKEQLNLIEKRLSQATYNLKKLEREKDHLNELLKKANATLYSTLCEKTTLSNLITGVGEEIDFYEQLIQETRSDACKIKLLPTVEEMDAYKIRMCDTLDMIREDFRKLGTEQMAELNQYYEARLDELRREERAHGFIDATVDIKLKDEDPTVGRRRLQTKFEKLNKEHDEMLKEENQLKRFITQQQLLHNEQHEEQYKKEKELDSMISKLSQNIGSRYVELNNTLEKHASLNFEVCAFRNLISANNNKEDSHYNKINNDTISPVLQQPLPVKIASLLASSTPNEVSTVSANVKSNEVVLNGLSGVHLSDETTDDQVTSDKSEQQESGNRTINKKYSGPVYIDYIDNNANYILLRNMSATDVDLQGWSLSRTVNDQQPTILFKFMQSIILKSGQIIKIYGDVAPTNTEENVWSAHLSKGWTFDVSSVTTLLDKSLKVKSTFSDQIIMHDNEQQQLPTDSSEGRTANFC